MGMMGGGVATPSSLLNGLVFWFPLNEVSDGSVPVSRLDLVSGESLADNGTVASETIDNETAAKFVTADSTYLSHADGAKWRFGNNTFTIVGRVRFTSHLTNRGVVTKGAEFVFRNVSDGPHLTLWNGTSSLVTLEYAGLWTTLDTWIPFRAGFDKVQSRVFMQLGQGVYFEKDVVGTPGSNSNTFQIGSFVQSQFHNGHIRNVGKYDRLLTYGEWYQLSTTSPAPNHPFSGLGTPPVAPTYTATTQGRTSLTNFEAATLAGYSKILVVGDSWTERADFPARLRSVLQSEYGNGGIGYYSFLDSSDNTDARITSVSQTGTWTQVSSTGFGIDISHVSISNTATLNWNGTFDKIVFHFRQVSGGGVFKYQIDGGGYTTVDTNGATAYQTTIVTGLTNTSHTVNVEWVSGTVILFGAEMTSGTTGIVVYKCGHGGSTTTQYKDADQANFEAAVLAFDPDLCIILLGTNDQSQNTIPATYAANIATIAARLPATCDFLMVPSADAARNIMVGLTYSLYQYAEAIYLAGGWDAFFNAPNDFGQWGYTINKSYWESNIHLSQTGANALADMIITEFLTGW